MITLYYFGSLKARFARANLTWKSFGEQFLFGHLQNKKAVWVIKIRAASYCFYTFGEIIFEGNRKETVQTKRFPRSNFARANRAFKLPK